MPLKYYCDMVLVGQSWKRACRNPAKMIFDDGTEEHFFCAHHIPEDWGKYKRIYAIENDERFELGISKHRYELATDLLSEPEQRLAERIYAHALGVKLD